MNKSLPALFLLCLSLGGVSQEVLVKDQVTHQPLELVTVVSWQPKAYTVSDAKGRVDLAGFEGSDSIVFQLITHETLVTTYEDLIGAEGVKEIYLKRGALDLSGVTISAARWEQEKRDIPYKISAISPERIEVSNPQTAADMLQASGEVYVQKSQMGGGSPMIRGFATNRVMLNIDGVRMNNAIFRSGNLQNVISLDPLAIEQTEVVFGPGSVIYGSDAIGGVMSFYTLEPALSKTDEPLVKGNAFVRGATANRERTGHIDFNVGWKKLAFVTSISYSDFEDLEMGSNGPKDYLRPEYADRIDGRDTVVENPNSRLQVPTGYDQINVMQKIRFKPNRFWDFQYGGHYSTTSDYSRYDRLTRYRNDQLRSAEWYYGPQEWMMHSVRAIHERANTIYDKMSITAGYQYFKESRHDRDFGSTLRSNRTERVYAYSVNADFEQDLGDRHEVFYGVEGVFNQVDSKGTNKDIESGGIAKAQSRYPDGSTWASMAVYFSDRFRINEKLTVLGGVRYNVVNVNASFDTTFYPFPFTEANLLMDALNGSLGLAWKPTRKWQININGSTGFRAPNIDDVGKVFDSEPGAVVIPNANLQPEYAYNAEASAMKIFSEFLKVDATAYYTFLNNALVRRNFHLNGNDSVFYAGELSQVQAIQNAAQAMVYGIQTGFDLKLKFGFGASSRFNYQWGEEELDDGSKAPLRHAAPYFGITRITYVRERIRAEVYAEYNGEVSNKNLAPSEQGKDYIYALDGNGNPYSPAWMTFNVKGTYQITDAFMVSAGVENLSDVRYRPYSSGISAPGRNFIGAVKYTF